MYRIYGNKSGFYNFYVSQCLRWLAYFLIARIKMRKMWGSYGFLLLYTPRACRNAGFFGAGTLPIGGYAYIKLEYAALRKDPNIAIGFNLTGSRFLTSQE